MRAKSGRRACTADRFWLEPGNGHEGEARMDVEIARAACREAISGLWPVKRTMRSAVEKQEENKRMKKAILATKVGMTQIFNEDGVLTPVTVLQAGPCVVTQVKTVENDGYSAVQVGFADIREKLLNKPEKGQFDKAEVPYKRYVQEFRFEDAENYEVKQEIKADIFAVGDKVDATAISKGKGFQGAIKRHGQSRGPMTHGSKYHRHAGSNGAASDPSKVFKGKKMPGQMGHVQVTVQNLEIVRVDAENNLLLVKGSVPGPKKSLVTIRETVKQA